MMCVALLHSVIQAVTLRYLENSSQDGDLLLNTSTIVCSEKTKELEHASVLSPCLGTMNPTGLGHRGPDSYASCDRALPIRRTKLFQMIHKGALFLDMGIKIVFPQ